MSDDERARAALEAALRPYVPDLLRSWPRDCAWQALEGTMVSADISGFTSLAERLGARGREGAEELNALISSCFEGMIEHCDRHGGDVVKFGGDALLVWFSGEAHAERACRSAVAMRSTIRRRRTTSDGKLVRLAVSIGMHSGTHHVFAIHSGCHDLIVSGPAASATVAAESAASAGEILLTHSTAQLVPQSWLGESRSEGVTLRRLTAGRRRSPAPDVRIDVWRPAEEFVSDVQKAQAMAGTLNEHRQVAVSFVAFGGTDDLIAAGRVDEVAQRLRAVAASIADSCARNGVFLLATDVNPQGGKFMMAAGAPLSRGGDDERMLRAVREIVDADPGIDLRAGVTRGYVFGCDLGSPRRRVYTVMGDAVNLSARLMSKAQPGEILISRPTIEWASSRFEYDALEPFLVKGKSVPIYAGRLGRLLGRRTDLDQVDSAMCGRTAELDTLLELADAAIRGRGAVVVVNGEPGIGKSRLAVEVVRRRLDFTVVFARCQPFDRLTAYAVAEPILRPLFGIDVEASPVEAGTGLVEWLDANAPDVVAFAPLLAVAVGADVPPTPESEAVVPAFRRVRTLQLLSTVIARSIVAPTAVIIDDVNHADDATRELIDVMASLSSDLPLLIIATSGTDETLSGERIALGQLDESDVIAMIDALLGSRAIVASTVRSIVRRAAGNPLFVSELLRSLAEDPDAEVPSSLEALVESRIDTLEPADRKLLREASVLGSEVDIALLARMSDDTMMRRQDRWDRLDRFLERVAPDVVRFRYDTYHRVAYGGLSYRTRRTLHRRVIDVLESVQQPDVLADGRERLALLAFHAHHGADRQRSWRYATAGAAASAEAAMFEEAARLYTLALHAHVEASSDEMRIVAEQAGDVYEVVGQLDAAERALALATRHSTSGLDQSRLWRKRAEVAERAGNNRQAMSRLTRAAAVLKPVTWSESLREHARWESARSVMALRQSRHQEAWNFATSALMKAQLVEDWKTAAHAALMVDNLVTSLRWKGVVVQRPDVVALCRLAGDMVSEAKYLSNRAVDHYFEGDWRRAMQLYRESAERSAEYGHAVSEATCLNNIAEILSDQGRYDDAASMFREAGRTWRSIGYGIGIAYADSNLGRLATRTGRHAEARQQLEAAGSRFRALGSTADLTEVALRTIDDRLVAGDPVPDDLWPPESDLDVDPTLRVAGDRLRALAASDAQARREAIDRSVAGARAAEIPFELALSLRVRAALAGDESDAGEAEAILSGLEVVTAPPLPVLLRTSALVE